MHRTEYSGMDGFNPRSREGSDDQILLYIHLLISFQSTLPRRERRSLICRSMSYRIRFNPRSREGSDPIRCIPFSQVYLCFNPRSREGSDSVPTNGADWIKVSIHAPAKGATLMQTFYTFETGCFNPRSREGSDVDCGACGIIDRVSIHAPAKGATAKTLLDSTDGCFNPRSREGSDGYTGFSSEISEQVSIHAPAKGATKSADDIVKVEQVSIHAPAKGATFLIGCFIVVLYVSIHAPAKGATDGCVVVKHFCNTCG